MITNFTQEEFDFTKMKGMVSMICCACNEVFETRKEYVLQGIREPEIGIASYCSKKCFYKTRNTACEISCTQCSKIFLRLKKKIQERNFCSQSCGTTYNNTHKTKGIRRSKLEVFLEGELIKLYPELEIHFNRKDTINSELDIYIPSLKLAFELNGIFHYEPIYGAEKLLSIQNNDNRKFQACLERGIELCIIDSSKISYWKPTRGFEILEIIQKILEIKKLNASTN